ncbi:MAG: hypothetical protein ACLGIW_21445 [Gammaproteobacteria bacterium]
MADSRMTARERAYVRRLELENAQLGAQNDKHIDIYREQTVELIELRARLDLLAEVVNG